MEATNQNQRADGYPWTGTSIQPNNTSPAKHVPDPVTHIGQTDRYSAALNPHPIGQRITTHHPVSALFDDIITGQKSLSEAARIGDLSTLYALQQCDTPMTPREEILRLLKQAILSNRLTPLPANTTLELCTDLMRDAVYEANTRGQFSLLEALIQHELFQKTPQHKGLSISGGFLLTKAIECQRPVVIDWILQSCPPETVAVNVEQKTGTTPLHIACEKGDQRTVALLIQQGANPLQPNHDGTTPLDLALQHKHWDMINTILHTGNKQQTGEALRQALIDNKVTSLPENQCLPVWRILVSYAIRMANVEKTFWPLERLIALGLDFSSPSFRKAVKKHGHMLFSDATRLGSYETIKWLLNHPDAPPFARDKVRHRGNDTPLHMAIRVDDKEMAKLLLPHSDIESQNSFGDTPVTMALKRSREWLRLIDPELAMVIEAEQQPASLVSTHSPSPASNQVACLPPPESHYQALNDMMSLYGLGEHTPPELLRQIAISSNNFKALSVIEHVYFPHHNQPVRYYDKLVIMTMDDDPKRLAGAYPQYKRFPGADFVNMKKDQDKKCREQERVVYRNTPFTRRSKIIIDGHGPHLGGMSGEEFAYFLDNWLTRHNCDKDQTPKITLNSCKTAGDQPIVNFLGMTFVTENFVEGLLNGLALLGRYPTVTATSGVMIGFVDGQEICGHFEDQPDGTTKVIKWAGQNAWVIEGYAESRKMSHLHRGNYDPSLINEYFFNTLTGSVESCQKHEASDDVLGGLHSIMTFKTASK